MFFLTPPALYVGVNQALAALALDVQYHLNKMTMGMITDEMDWVKNFELEAQLNEIINFHSDSVK